jgi:radical SAM superfamily enzyme YgiQ (UPF0313 family)
MSTNSDQPISPSKANILLIDCSSHVTSVGVRSIAAYLREKETHTDILYLPGDGDLTYGTISDHKLATLHSFSKSYDLIGMSIGSHHYMKRVLQITNFLKKKISAPIILGGVPVICDPEWFLQFNPYVCLGEGEAFLHEVSECIIQGTSFLDVQNLGYRDPQGRIHLNKVAPFIDLGDAPPSIYSFDNSYILRDRPVSFREAPEVLENATINQGYLIFPIRGCPFNCTFCANNALKNSFKNSGKIVRYSSLEGMLQELEHGAKHISNMKVVRFSEDDFFVRSEEELETFCDQYPKRINLPIVVNATFHNMTPEKVDILIKSGIKINRIKFGIQSGSQWTNREIYKRNFNPELIKDRLKYLFKKKIYVILDLITLNPFESDRERSETAAFLFDLLNEVYYKDRQAMKKYVYLFDHKLMFYPGTQLYEWALEKNMIGKNYVQEVILQRDRFRKKMEIDTELLAISAFNNAYWLPSKTILKLLGNVRVFRLLNSHIFKVSLSSLYLLLRSLRRLMSGPYSTSVGLAPPAPIKSLSGKSP